MGGPRVTRWRRYGHDRLYVSSPSGENLGWMDLRTGEITTLQPGSHDAVLRALGPHLTQPSMPQNALAEADDLASNRPGDGVRAQAERLAPGVIKRTLWRWLGLRTRAWSWETGLAGEVVVGRQLDSLAGRGWHILHSIPLPNNSDIDHLAIGPGGVFSVNTKHFRKASIWVGDDSAKVNHGPARPLVRHSRHEARRVLRVLQAGTRREIPVRGVLAFVAAADLTVVPTLRDVEAVHGETIDATLLGQPTRLNPAQVAALYAIARDKRAWQRAWPAPKGAPDGGAPTGGAALP